MTKKSDNAGITHQGFLITYAYISGNKAVVSCVSATATQTGRVEFVYPGVDKANDRTKEARVRVRSAIEQSGGLLSKTITIESPAFGDRGPIPSADLATAISILEATNNIPPWQFDRVALIGELTLTGHLRPVRGVCLMIRAAIKAGLSAVIVPRACAAEAVHVHGIYIMIADSLGDVIAAARSKKTLDEVEPKTFTPAVDAHGVDFSDVKAIDPRVKRAFEIAAVGGHGLLMTGPAGAGKTMLARRLATILPKMTADEAAETTEVHSLAGLIHHEVGTVTGRPFRAPHHTVSAAGLVGGGSPLRPGEVSLSHNGVLFLDELPEFRTSCLEQLGYALRRGASHLVRSGEVADYPARPMLVAAAQPCACGFAEEPRRCSCSDESKKRWAERLTKGFAARFEIRVRLKGVSFAALKDAAPSESSDAIRERVVQARAFRAERLAMGGGEESPSALDRVARTIADMAQSASVLPEHYEEARLYA